MSTVLKGQDFFSCSAIDLQGQKVSMGAFRGKVILVVNTASECGFTPQYRELEDLYRAYKEKGFVVLGFPSNDFAGQEPLKGTAISDFCEKEYQVTFPLFERSGVRGITQNEVFTYLTNKQKNGVVNVSPVWNFQKYLIDREGRVVDYFLPTTSPGSSKIRRQIEKLLGEPTQ